MSNEASARVLVNVPREQAWKKLRDLSLAHHYVPGIIKTEITTTKKEGIGASRRVFQSETRGIDETVTEWEAGHGFVIRLHRGDKGAPPPFEEAWFRYHLDDAGNGQTALSTTLIYKMRWGGFGRFLQRYVLGKTFRSVIRDVAVSMKAYYESGEPTTPDRLKQLKASAAPPARK